MLREDVTKHTVVVMDGTHEDVVQDIMDWMDDITKTEFGKATCRPLDSKHPTIMVIETKTTDVSFDLIRLMIDIRYPKLCIFDPPM